MINPLRQIKEARPSRQELRGHLRRIERVSLRHAHKFIIRRVENLRAVRRHIAGWLLLITALITAVLWQSTIVAEKYSAEIPVEGGVYSEGVFGVVDNINPIFASSPAERAASRLLFANLLSYDNQGDLVGVLAQQWRSDKSGKIYSLTLRKDAKWQDGAPINADDVLFTFRMIKNADTRSPLYSSWRNIVVQKVNERTVRFILPAPYTAFLNSLAVGILPQHILKNVRPAELRTNGFNRSPSVTSGPFVFQDLRGADVNQKHYLVQMSANNNYVLGKPKLAGFHLHAYKDQEDLTRAFRSQEVASFSDASIDQINTLGSTDSYVQIDAPLYNGVYAFFKTDNPLLKDPKVRKAMQMATDRGAIIDKLGGKVGPLEGPILPGQLGFRENVRQPGLNIKKAKKLMRQAGWKFKTDGTLVKDGKPLRLRLVTVSSGDYPVVAEEIMRQWQRIGVQFDSDSGLVRAEEIQQNAIVPRVYDVLIYQIAIGRDPDVYAYWHSSQASERGLNLSNYRSAKVDDALDSARSRPEALLRKVKYQLFVEEWLADAPAVALYRPTLTYVQNKNVISFPKHSLVDPNDRYFNVGQWAAGREPGRPTR